MKKIIILIISGSASVNSHSATNAEYLKHLLHQKGVTAIHWNLQKQPLPFHLAEEHHSIENSRFAEVREFVRLAKTADGFIWCTPNYHNSFTGVLKNALDQLTMALIAHKPVLLVANGGGRFGGNPCEQLRLVARGLHCVAIPLQIVTQASDFESMNGIKRITEKNILKRFDSGVDQLYEYCVRLQR